MEDGDALARALPVLPVLFLRIELRVDGITVKLRRKQQSLWSQMKWWQLKITHVVCPKISRSGEVPMGIWANRKIINISGFPALQTSKYQKGQDSTCWTPERQVGTGKSKARALPSSQDHKTIKHLTTLWPCCWSKGPESLGADSLLHESGVWLFQPQALKQRDRVLKLHRPWFPFQVSRVNQESQLGPVVKHSRKPFCSEVTSRQPEILSRPKQKLFPEASLSLLWRSGNIGCIAIAA